MDEESICRGIEREIDSFSLDEFDTRWKPLRERHEKAPFYKRICDYANARRKTLQQAANFEKEDEAGGRRWLKEDDP